MDAEPEIDRFHWHEALDRTQVVAELFENVISCHPVITNNPELDSQATSIGAALADLYQAIGSKNPHWVAENE